MKGQSTIFMLAIMIITASVTIAFYLSIPYGALGKVEVLTFSQDMYTMDNALSAAKIYSQTALSYSAYQACYDAYYSVSRFGALSEEGFKQSLEDGIARNFQEYVSEDYVFLRQYPVKFPEYTVEIEPKSDSLVVKATGKDLLIRNVSSTISIALNKSSSISQDVKTPCWGTYQEALKLNSSLNEKMHPVIADLIFEEEEMPQYHTGVNLKWEDVEGNRKTDDQLCEEVFVQSDDATFEAAGKDLYDKLLARVGTDSFEQEMMEGVPGIKNFIAHVSYLTIDHKAGDVEQVDVEEKIINLPCSFTYLVRITFTAVFNPSQKEYPVWNGTDISFEPLELKFFTDFNWDSGYEE